MNYTLTAHFGTAILRDSARDADNELLYLTAKIRSGDYFDDLASKLETVQEALSPIKIDDLDSIIDDLLYLQRHYELQQKETNNT